MYMPLITPTGNANIALPTISQKVPTIAGMMPPFVIPSVGGWVRKSQLITPIPLMMMNPSIRNSMTATL